MMKDATPIGWRWVRGTERLIDSCARTKRRPRVAEASIVLCEVRLRIVGSFSTRFAAWQDEVRFVRRERGQEEQNVVVLMFCCCAVKARAKFSLVIHEKKAMTTWHSGGGGAAQVGTLEAPSAEGTHCYPCSLTQLQSDGILPPNHPAAINDDFLPIGLASHPCTA